MFFGELFQPKIWKLNHTGISLTFDTEVREALDFLRNIMLPFVPFCFCVCLIVEGLVCHLFCLLWLSLVHSQCFLKLSWIWASSAHVSFMEDRFEQKFIWALERDLISDFSVWFGCHMISPSHPSFCFSTINGL